MCAIVPRGVGKDFLQLLDGEQSVDRMRLIVMAIVGLVLLAPAFFLWPPMGLVVHLAAWLVGMGLGWLIAARTSRGYEASLRGRWNTWMKLAPACDSVPELARKVRGRRATFQVAWIAAGLTLLWVLEIGLLVLAFMDLGSPAFSAPVIIANGLLVGVVAGHSMQLLTWTRAFHRSLDEMMRDGEIGVWGAMG